MVCANSEDNSIFLCMRQVVHRQSVTTVGSVSIPFRSVEDFPWARTTRTDFSPTYSFLTCHKHYTNTQYLSQYIIHMLQMLINGETDKVFDLIKCLPLYWIIFYLPKGSCSNSLTLHYNCFEIFCIILK